MDENLHEHHIWDVGKVRALVADHSFAATFFCGGSRNFAAFIDLFDGVFVLDVDLNTLNQRLAARPELAWGSRLAERQFVRRLHATKEDVPREGVPTDLTGPVGRVVDEILQKLTSLREQRRILGGRHNLHAELTWLVSAVAGSVQAGN